MWPHIPKHQMVIRAITGNFVSLLLESVCQCSGIVDNLFGVLYKGIALHLEKLRCKTTNLMIMWTTLQTRENCHVDPVLDIRDLVRIFEEDHTCARSP